MKKFYTFKSNTSNTFDVGYYDDRNSWRFVFNADTAAAATFHVSQLNMSERKLENDLQESLSNELKTYSERLEKMVRSLVSNSNFFLSKKDNTSTIETADSLIRELDEFYSKVETKSKEKLKLKT